MTGLHHRPLALTAGAALIGAVGYWLPATALVSARARRVFAVRATISRHDALSLTFDDGPHPEGTPAALKALSRVHAPATFFLAGEQVERWPALAAEIVAAGHDVGIHCHRHRGLMRLTPRQVGEDLSRAADAIAVATGHLPRYYRPPYGILTAAALMHARRMGWDLVLWRRDGRDWEAAVTPVSIADRILRKLEPGDIVLLHDADHYSAPGSWRRTVAAIELLAAGWRERQLVAARLA